MMDQSLAVPACGEPKIKRGRRPKDPGSPACRRPREHIGYAEGLNLIRGVHHAGAIDKPLNVRVDVQWRLAPTRIDVFERRKRLLNAIGNWLRRTAGRGDPGYVGDPVYVYVREIGLGGHEHLHLAVHVPEGRTAAFRAMVCKAASADAEPKVCPIRYPNDGEPVKVQNIRPGSWNIDYGVTSYFLKEGCAELLELRIGDRPVVDPKHQAKATGGVVYGKRVGVSRAIGRKARQTHRGLGFGVNATAGKGTYAASQGRRVQGVVG